MFLKLVSLFRAGILNLTVIRGSELVLQASRALCTVTVKI